MKTFATIVATAAAVLATAGFVWFGTANHDSSQAQKPAVHTVTEYSVLESGHKPVTVRH